MEKNIVKTVYDSLKKNTEEIRKDVDALNELEKKISSGRYSPKALKEEFYPKRTELKNKIESASAGAIQSAKGMIAQYRKDVEELNCLNPSDLTDDIKLLQAGVPLLSRDIQSMLSRNSSNRTMTQLILRYAKEHEIDTGNTIYIGGDQERETADGLDAIVSRYANWIDKDNAQNILDRFFE